jgi:hypothetical protein
VISKDDHREASSAQHAAASTAGSVTRLWNTD